MFLSTWNIWVVAALVSCGTAQKVTVQNGTILGGKCLDTETNYFFSIPFAQPPVGHLRLKTPLPYDEAYGGMLNGTVRAPSCVQFNKVFSEANTQSEDCLYLDVWAPSSATADSRLPVKVWVYGGVNEAGGISDPTYDGCYATSSSIIVSINYRVGPLGFLALEELGLRGNFGISDQLLALQWIQENIHAFGGDRSRVMIYGQSAGATDAYAISTLPQAPKLLHSAIFESGGGREFASLGEVQHWQRQFLHALNCSAANPSCVNAAPPDVLVAAEAQMYRPTVPAATTPFVYLGARTRWGPVVDGHIIAELPTKVGNKVPAVFGFNADEGTLFVLGSYAKDLPRLNQSHYDDFLNYNFGPLAAKVNATYSAAKFQHAKLPIFAAISTVLGEVTFKCPAYRALVTSAKTGVPAWTYEFKHGPTCAWYGAIPASILPLVGAAHTAEIPFQFNTTHKLPLPSGNCTFTAAEQSLAASMSQAWTNMAASGKPGGAREWPNWTAETSGGVNIDTSMVVGTVDYTSCEFWDTIFDESVQLASHSSCPSR